MGRRQDKADTPRHGVNTRIRDDLRAKLDQAAIKNDRTLGNEIERRLEASFAASQAPSFEDVRLMIREEIRAALAEWPIGVAVSPTSIVCGPRASEWSPEEIAVIRSELHDPRSPLQRAMRQPENA